MGMRPAARMPKLTRRSRILITIALAVILLLLVGPRLIDGYVDWLWFGESGYRSVFTTVLLTRLVVFLVVGLLVGGIVFAALGLAYRTRPVFVLSNGNDPVARYRTVVMSRLRVFEIGIQSRSACLPESSGSPTGSTSSSSCTAATSASTIPNLARISASTRSTCLSTGSSSASFSWRCFWPLWRIYWRTMYSAVSDCPGAPVR